MCDYPFKRAGKEEKREARKSSIKRAKEKTTRKRQRSLAESASKRSK